LSLLPSPPPPEPLLHEQATQGHASDRDSGAIDSQEEEALPERADASSPDDGEIDGNAEIDELLRALSESSSSEEDKDDEIEQARLKPDGSSRKLKSFGGNGPTSNIALLMVACWTLRLPVMYMDLIRLDSYMLVCGIGC
jgi:RNA polymerase I-specific transcription initiation factor RRN7